MTAGFGRKEAKYESMAQWLDVIVVGLVVAGFLSGARAGFLRVALRLAGLAGGVALGLSWAPAVGLALYQVTGLARWLEGWLSPRLPAPALAPLPGGTPGLGPVLAGPLGGVPDWLTDMLARFPPARGGPVVQVALLLVDAAAFMLILLVVQVAAEVVGRVLQATVGHLPGLGLPVRLAGGLLGGLQAALFVGFLLAGAGPILVALWPELAGARSLVAARELTGLALHLWRGAAG